MAGLFSYVGSLSLGGNHILVGIRDSTIGSGSLGRKTFGQLTFGQLTFGQMTFG
jgi:hypothetical protein